MTEYRAYFTNGGMANFTFDGDPEEDLDAFLDAAYEEAPSGLCHHCAGNFDISDDMEVYDITNTETKEQVYREPTWQENLEKSNTALREKSDKAHAEIVELRKQRDNLTFILRKAGFTVDPDTYAVSR